MNICVGGELDGQVIEKEGRLLKASDINPSFQTEYYKQIYNRENVVYQFWLPVGSDLHEMPKLVLDILRAPKKLSIIYIENTSLNLYYQYQILR
ncbi:hypothetical protein [Acinetobacter baumannii]|uniref:hypothetical protein n=2 Tax=Acinetobacter baumannii TaxID=470 RepID=UPI0038B49871